jgi:hypothetical protein
MNIPQFTAQASLYRASNRYRSSVADFAASIPAQSVVAAYIPGAETMNRCSGCIDACTTARDVCLAKTAVMVTEACWASLGFGCGAAIAWGYIQAASCESVYLECFGFCNIPSGPGWKGFCCPKVCGLPTPGKEGTGCCDHGEACVAQDDPNSRDGCCPVGHFCGGRCCPTDAPCCGSSCCPPPYSCIEGVCTTGFGTGTPPPPHGCPPGAAPCGFPDSSGVIRTCCPPGLKCCGYTDQFGPDCRTTCLH